MIIPSYLVTLWALLLVSCGPTVAQSVAVFDFELIDTSLEGAIRGARPDEQEARPSERSIAAATRGLGPVLARRYHADRTRGTSKQPASVRWLRYPLGPTHRGQTRDHRHRAEVSNLILNMNIYVRDASSGATIAAMSADMRGNTDETWSRALDWLVRNRLLAPGYGLQR